MLYETPEEAKELFERSVVGMVVTYSERDSPDSRDTRVRLVRTMMGDEDVEAARVHDVVGRKRDGQIRIEIQPVTGGPEPEPRWWQFWRR